jgi:hypothetical protein
VCVYTRGQLVARLSADTITLKGHIRRHGDQALHVTNPRTRRS